MEYFRLLDRKNRGIIAKADGRIHHEYDREKKEWVRSGVMIEYFCDESDTYGMYEEITEKEAMSLIQA